MGYQEIGGSLIYRPWKEWEVGDFVEGYFQKTKEDQFGKTNYILKVIDSNIDKFTEGKLVCLNSAGSLESKINEAGVVKGNKVFSEYLGTGIVGKGPFKGKEFHDVRVMVDDSVFDSSNNESTKESESTMESETIDPDDRL